MHLTHKAIITDPCYNLDTWCNYIVSNVLPGPYTTTVKLTDEGDCNERVAELLAIHMEYTRVTLDWEFVSNEIGVDSGQCGIYDLHYFMCASQSQQEKEQFLDEVHKHTSSEKQCGEQHGFGVTACSGYGDGCYNLYIAKNQQKEVVAMKIVFIYDEEE